MFEESSLLPVIGSAFYRASMMMMMACMALIYLERTTHNRLPFEDDKNPAHKIDSGVWNKTGWFIFLYRDEHN